MSTSFGMCTLYLTRYEQQSIGLHWSNLWESPLVGDRMNFGVALMCLIADCAIYFAAATIIVYFRRALLQCCQLAHSRSHITRI